MSKWGLLLVISGLVVTVGSPKGQGRVDFTGHWRLGPSPTNGNVQSRGTRSDGGGVRTTYVSGGVVNCGTECTIVQNVRTMTISRPADEQGNKPLDVVLNLDGASIITERLEPHSEYTAYSKWDGSKLMVTRSLGPFGITQTVSLENGQLNVVSVFDYGSRMPFTLRYDKR